MKTETVKLSQIHVNSANPRTITDEKFRKLVNSILVLPKMLELRPIVVDDTMTALGGNMRYRALVAIADMSAEELAERLHSQRDYQKKTAAEQQNLVAWWAAWKDSPSAPVIKASELSDDERREFIIKGSRPENASLQDRFVVPPFSVLDTRKGYWQTRKKMWRELIGDMGESRNDTLITSPEIKYKDLYQRTQKHRKELGISFVEYLDKYVPDEVKEHEASKVLSAGVSLFDPVLAEIMCKWFTPAKGGRIFDPFAGDTQKGFVFGTCGFDFTGIELRKEQVEINNRVIADRDLPVRYVCDDGQNVAKHIAAESQDLLFSCPPYFDLEHYSDLPNDASNQGSYSDFVGILRNAFTSAIGCLKNDRFAVIVVGDIRNRATGCYYDFCGDIKRIFKDGGMDLYNEIILVETGASTALRASRYMESRKVAKMHQNILVFYKGSTKNIKKNFPKIEFTEDELSAFDKEQSTEAITNDGQQV